MTETARAQPACSEKHSFCRLDVMICIYCAPTRRTNARQKGKEWLDIRTGTGRLGKSKS